MSPRRSGAVFDPRFWFQVVLSAGVGAFLMAVVLPGLALVRDTTGHDWYAAGKVTAAQTVIASGFDRDAPIQYRSRDGETETLTRYSMTFKGEALWARSRIVSTALRHAVLGIAAGALLAALLEILWTHRRSGGGHRGEIRPTRGRSPPTEAWNGVCSVKGLLMLKGMAPVGVVVVPPAGAEEPAKVYGPPEARTALLGAQDKPVGKAVSAETPKALPAPESGHEKPESDRHEGPPNKPPVRSKPKPAAPRGREQRKRPRPKPGKGKLWF